MRSAVWRSSTRARPARPRARACSGFCWSVARADARRSTLPAGTRTPVLGSIRSGTPPTLVATTGSSLASASRQHQRETLAQRRQRENVERSEQPRNVGALSGEQYARVSGGDAPEGWTQRAVAYQHQVGALGHQGRGGLDEPSLVLLWGQATDAADHPSLGRNTELAANVGAGVGIRTEGGDVDAVFHHHQPSRSALVLAAGDFGQRWRDGDVGVHQRGRAAAQPTAAAAVGIPSVFAVHHRGAGQASSGGAVHQRLWVVRVDDVDVVSDE